MSFLLTFVAGLILVRITTSAISNGSTMGSKAVPKIEVST